MRKRERERSERERESSFDICDDHLLRRAACCTNSVVYLHVQCSVVKTLKFAVKVSADLSDSQRQDISDIVKLLTHYNVRKLCDEL